MDRSQTGMDQLEDDTPNTSAANEESKSSSVLGDSVSKISTPPEDKIPSHLAEKADAIRRACDLRDFDALVSFAISEGGFLWDDLRQLACERDTQPLDEPGLTNKPGPILLQCNQGRQHEALTTWKELPRHRDEDQVQLDVNRSFVYYPNGKPSGLSTAG